MLLTKNFISAMAAVALLAACGKGESEYDATGTFEATEVTVSAEQSGRIMSLGVTEGQRISAGQQVALIDTVQPALRVRQLGADRESIARQRPDEQAQTAATRQEIAKAELEVKRYRGLVADGAAGRKQLDDAESHLAVLKRQLAAQLSELGHSTSSLNSRMSSAQIQRLQAADQLAKCHVAAPISGTVLEKYAEAGDFATIGKPLFKIADTDNLFLRAYITSVQLSRVKLGQRVKVFADYGGDTKRTYDGTVTWISQQAEFTPKSILTDDDRADQVYAVKIRIHGDGYVRIGMYGEVKL